MYLLNALPALKKSGVELEFLCLHPKGKQDGIIDFKKRMEENGIKCHSIPFSSFPFISSLRRIHSLIREGNFDLVHSHLIHADFLLAYYKKILNPRLKLVSTKHGYQEWYNNKYGFNPGFKKNNFYLRVARFAEKQCNASIAISKGLYKLYTGLNICQEDRLVHIPYGFDFPDDLKEDDRFRFSSQQFVLVGRLTAFKGHRYALEAIKHLTDEYPELKLLFVGSGPEEESLKSLSEELALDANVEFLGYSKEARSYMRNSDIVLVPSVSEGFGVVVLEAFSVSKPIICFDVPSLNEHIEQDVNGKLVEAYDVQAYAEAIKDLIDHPEKAKSFGLAGYQKLKEFYNLDRMTKQTLSFYHDLLS